VERLDKSNSIPRECRLEICLKVNEIFVIAERGEAQLLIPEIVLGELIYILRKG